MKIAFLWVHPLDDKSIKINFPKAKIFHDLSQSNSKIDEIKNVEILSVFIINKLPKNILEKLPNLKIIFTRSVWVDHIDLDFCKKKWIKVCNIPDYGSHIISELAFWLMISAMRHISEYDKSTSKWIYDFEKEARWKSLRWKTLWIIWTWKIWLNAIWIWKNWFQMNVIAYDKFQNKSAEKEYWFSYVSLDELLKKSDIISLHIPHFPETFHMINKENIAKMKTWVVLINTSRWEIICSKSLLNWLKSWKISFAGIDVIEDETHCENSKELLSLKNVIATPHIWAYTEEAIKNIFDATFKNISNFLEWKKLENEIIFK